VCAFRGRFEVEIACCSVQNFSAVLEAAPLDPAMGGGGSSAAKAKKAAEAKRLSSGDPSCQPLILVLGQNSSGKSLVQKTISFAYDAKSQELQSW
jgi:hypothetical protein